VRERPVRRRHGWFRTLLFIAFLALLIGGWHYYAQAQAEDTARTYRENATAVISSKGYKVVEVDAASHLVLLEGPKGQQKWFNIQQDGIGGRDFSPTTACAVTTDLELVADTCAVNHQSSP
jgi:hypothetical protein